jgi:hypothetical protein
MIGLGGWSRGKLAGMGLAVWLVSGMQMGHAAPGHPGKASTHSAGRSGRAAYATTFRGAWVEEVGVCTKASADIEHQNATFTCTTTGTLTGQLTAQALEKVENTVDAAGNEWGNIDEWLVGRSSDNTCGSLHIVEDFVLDGASNAVHGVGRIVEGRGDWIGARGHYEVNGVIVGGGFGGYELTLSLPAEPKPSSTPCIPPPPDL